MIVFKRLDLSWHNLISAWNHSYVSTIIISSNVLGKSGGTGGDGLLLQQFQDSLQDVCEKCKLLCVTRNVNG